ncbi:serine/arginine-rich splicing factor 5 isoform X1 [Pocillopora verrucosa]|uniref:serine/arginine-rich splicing factor 5-like isoform X1 n=1 Tax=Pocillopora damicornis TaxID=46731 RepID=UPI000F54E18A|nr:serine/arginine-rich splicing factor 5-like isoform X1 [Pocillopora damicornis]XP_058953114.1 serine/arginine-rich splicing factor 5-like isoform X1 [Pocillopora verrucosa]
MSRGGTRVYFGRLPRDTRERDLERFVRGFGRIREVSIKLGYGFVEFDDSRDADDCVYDLNGRELLGERVVVEHARNPSRSQDYGYRSQPSSSRSSQRRGRTPPLRTEHRLAVENLSSRINWQDLKEYISKAGEVTFADAHKRRQGEGVVEFASKEDMKAALKKLDDTELHGKRIRLKVEKVRSSSRRSRSRSRSRSPKRRKRSHSHSRSQSKSRSKSPKKRHRSSSRSRSPSKSRKSRSQSKEKERSRSKSVEEEEKKSPSPEKEEQEEEAEAEVEADGDEKEDSPEAVNGDEENGDAEHELEVEDEVEED